MQNTTDDNQRLADPIEDYAILLLDENGTILDWNIGAEKIKGYKAKEIIGKNFRVFYADQDRESKLPEQLIAKAIAHGSATHEGFRVRKDGSKFWGSILITALFDKTDKLTGFLKITRDLTEKKELEETLKKLNEGLEQQVKERTAELQKQFKEISDYKFAIDESSIVAITDLKGVIIHANDNFCKISKYSRDELIGQDHRIVNSGYHSKEFIRHLWVTITSGKIWKGEIKNKAKDGTTYWVDTTIVPFLSEAKKPTRYIAIRADITHQKEIKEQLIASEKRFRNVLENMMEGVQIIDFNWRYVYVNDSLARYSYHTKNQLVGYTIMEKYPGVEQTELYRLLKQCMEERTAHQLETEFVFPDGSKKDFEMNIQPVPEGIFILSVDITDRKNAAKSEYELNSRLKAIFEKTHDAIMLADGSGNYVQVNPAAAKMLGYSQQELTGMNAANIVSKRQSDELWNEFMQDGSQAGAVELIRKDGSLIICHYNASSNILPGLHLSILTDITEQKKAERDLIESEKKYRVLFHNNPMPMWMLDVESYSIMDVNDAAVVHYGYSRAEFLAMNARDLRPKEDVPLFEKQIVPSEREGTHLAGKWRHKKKNGEVIIVEIVSHDIKFGARNMRIVLANDVTDRERAIEELTRSEERLMQAQAVTKVGSWQTDLKTLKVLWSFETYRIFELDPETFEPIHSSFLSFVHPDDRSNVDDAFKNSFKHNGLNLIEHRIITAKGTLKHVEERWEILHSDSGEPVMATGTCQDITERQKTESKLAESENYLRTILYTEPECVKVLNRKGELLSMNPAGLAMIEADNEQQVLGHRMTELVDKKYRTGFNRLSKQVFNGESGTFEFEVTGLKGGHRWLETHAVPLKDTSGEIINLLGVTRDITHRKKTEEELKRSYKDIRQLNAHLQTVREEERAHISRELHDELGQQLTGIKMDMVWMGNKLASSDVSTSQRITEALQLIDETATTLRRINLDLRPEILDDLGLLAALDLYSDEFTKRTSIKCVVEEEGTEPELEKNIGINIFRIFQEALNNVAKHANASEVKALVKIGTLKLELTITDNGKGFNPLQVKNKKTYGLLGMKERVVAINGQLQIESAPGKGTCLHVIIPLNNQQTNL